VEIPLICLYFNHIQLLISLQSLKLSSYYGQAPAFKTMTVPGKVWKEKVTKNTGNQHQGGTSFFSFTVHMELFFCEYTYIPVQLEFIWNSERVREMFVN